jgi:hypothetical protein
MTKELKLGKTYFMLKFSGDSTQNMPKLPVAGVLGKADTCN